MGTENKTTVIEQLLWLMPWVIAVVLLFYFGRFIRPVLAWAGVWIDSKTRSQTMAAAELIQAGDLTPEKKAEIKARMATSRAYRKSLETQLDKEAPE